MSSQAFTPSSPSSITEEVSSRTMADVIKDYDTEELIEYLKRKDLKLKDSHFKILRKEELLISLSLNQLKKNLSDMI